MLQVRVGGVGLIKMKKGGIDEMKLEEGLKGKRG
jgi:hypothetical protein